MIPDPPRYFARFEWWILRAKKTYEEPIVGTVRGPFDIEVFFDSHNGFVRGRWVAQVLPTKQRLPDKFKTEKEAFAYVASNFKTQLEPWTVKV